MNRELAFHVLETVFKCGVTDFSICPSARNAPLISALVAIAEAHHDKVNLYNWPEERSAAFFCIGKSRATRRPVAVVTTSGTAAGELLPAAMEAHYSGVPLLLITADRPRRYRNTGAPQSAEQVGIYGCYTEFSEDLAEGEISDLYSWKQTAPAHLNICFEEPLRIVADAPICFSKFKKVPIEIDFMQPQCALKEFFLNANQLFVVVSAILEEDREAVRQFLLKLNAPVYLEAHSGLREDKLLSALKVTQPNKLFEAADQAGYQIDRVLRIGSVPTFRPWRDLEMRTDIQVCSLSHLPFSGLSCGQLIHVPLKPFLESIAEIKRFSLEPAQMWLAQDTEAQQVRYKNYQTNPQTEPAMVHHLSKIIPGDSMVYLGNSLPIREWDLAATTEQRNFAMYANRGANGIDGQISTFLGLCKPERENWAIIGDLTAIYDMAGLWILQQMPDILVRLVIINNSGGQIFKPMFPGEKVFLHSHRFNFKPLAEMWGMEYLRLNEIPGPIHLASKHTLIELVPAVFYASSSTA